MQKGTYRVDNGDGTYTDIAFKTTADQVTLKDGTDLQTYIDKKKMLWKGSYYMTERDTVILPKKISECLNGIELVWSDYDPGMANRTGNDFNWVHSLIPKQGAFINSSGDTLFVIGRIENDAPGDERAIIKGVYIKDDKLIGNDKNTIGLGNDVVLREIWEW